MDVQTNIARIFNTYGPRMQLKDGRVVPAFIDQVLNGEPMTVFGNGSQTRSFCYVSDMVRGLFLLSQSDERYPVNLGNPREMTILEFADCIQKVSAELPRQSISSPFRKTIRSAGSRISRKRKRCWVGSRELPSKTEFEKPSNIFAESWLGRRRPHSSGRCTA